MRILMLADGRSVHTVRYQNEMKRAGIQLLLASLEPGETVDGNLKHKTGVNFLNYALTRNELRRLADSFHPDIINPHFASGYGFAAALSGLHKKIPVLLHCLGSDILVSPSKSFLHRARVRLALSRAGHIIVDSQYLGEQVHRLGFKKEISIIPWGVEDSFLELFSKRPKQGLSGNIPLKVIVPRPHNAVYNNRFILEALSEMLKAGHISLTFPDWGDDRDNFKRMVQEKQFDKMVSFYDHRPRREYIDYFSSFDIYLSASLSDSSPASLLEAMGAGLFPVVADIPGVREWVSPENSLLFNPDRPETLQYAFKTYLDGNLPRGEILAHNHQMISEKARFSDNISATIEIMKRMIGREAK